MLRLPKLRRLQPIFLLALLASDARAHDFWIAPESFRPTIDARVAIDLQVGERFRGESVARNPEKVLSFVAHLADGTEQAIAGVDGKAPAGYWRPKSEGAACIVYRSRHSFLELDAPKFDRYLGEEGLEYVRALRAERGHSDRKGRERYSRSVKSLLWCGRAAPTADASVDAPIGLPIELCVERNPYALRAGAEMPVRLTFQGKPLEGALVGCMARSVPEKEVRLRSDAEGRVRFVLDRDGVWLVRAVHMAPCPEPEAADWESFWASTTFEIGAR